MHVEVLVFGAGIVGLWLTRVLHTANRSVVLLESQAVGAGQTGKAQGVIHYGYQYATRQSIPYDLLENLLPLPRLWQDHLGGNRWPTLRGTRVLANSYHIAFADEDVEVRTTSVWRQVGMPWARTSAQDCPDLLRHAPSVFTVPGPILEVGSLLRDLASPLPGGVILAYEPMRSHLNLDTTGHVRGVTITYDQRSEFISTQAVVFAAGEGNAALLRECQVEGDIAQVRPLRMTLLGGILPSVNCYYFSSGTAGFTLTSIPAHGQNLVWMVGGPVAETPDLADSAVQVSAVRHAIARFWPPVLRQPLRHATYAAPRYEIRATPAGNEIPSAPGIFCERNCVAVWPTKLTFTPLAIERILHALEPFLSREPRGYTDAYSTWPAPPFALTYPEMFAAGIQVS